MKLKDFVSKFKKDKPKDAVLEQKNVSGVKWSEDELKLFEQGLTDIEICKKTGRSMQAVQTKRRRLK